MKRKCQTRHTSSWKEIQKQRKSLPIFTARDKLVNRIKNCTCMVLVGETGSGKTTQIPQYLYDAGIIGKHGMIGVTQPRRVAAITVAKRVAAEMGVELGNQVGYSIRFDDMTTSSTRIKYMTDGMLLREIALDPLLSRYYIIILDEAHERTVNTDLLFAILKQIQQSRMTLIDRKKKFKTILQYNIYNQSAMKKKEEKNHTYYHL